MSKVRALNDNDVHTGRKREVTKIKDENKTRLRENAKRLPDKLAETDREGLAELLKPYQG